MCVKNFTIIVDKDLLNQHMHTCDGMNSYMSTRRDRYAWKIKRWKVNICTIELF